MGNDTGFECGQSCRPGGLRLTKRALQAYPLRQGARAADIGCGGGATAAYLNTIGVQATGIDLRLPPDAPPFLKTGNATDLPFADGSLDAVFFECSLSKITDWHGALGEAYRALRPGGLLYLSDLYARGERRSYDGLLGWVEPWAVLRAGLEGAGFCLRLFEDHSNALLQLYAQLLFEVGQEQLPHLLGGGTTDFKGARCGYFLAVLAKTDGPVSQDAWLEARSGVSGPAALRQWQEAMAAESILRAQAKSPFYATHLAGLTPADMRGEGWLSRLPFTDAESLSTCGARMLCVPAHEIARIRSIPTSGSTGPAKRIWFTQADLLRTVDFFSVGMRPLVQPGGTVAILMSNQQPDSVARLLAQGLARFDVNAVFCGQVRDAHDSADMVREADCLVGLPAELIYLCRKAPELRPKTVLLSADYLPPGVAQALEQEWGCRVFSHYGMTETGYGLAVQCPAGAGHHLRAADFLAEIIDPGTGQVLPPGTEGELVLTSLHNEALPLIRYRTGDITSLCPDPCICGSPYPRLGPIRGRHRHLTTAVNIHRLDDLLLSRPGICGFQAAWRAGRLHLRIEGPPQNTTSMEAQLGCPLEVEYGPVMPSGQGKRKIETW